MPTYLLLSLHWRTTESKLIQILVLKILCWQICTSCIMAPAISWSSCVSRDRHPSISQTLLCCILYFQTYILLLLLCQPFSGSCVLLLFRKFSLGDFILWIWICLFEEQNPCDGWEQSIAQGTCTLTLCFFLVLFSPYWFQLFSSMAHHHLHDCFIYCILMTVWEFWEQVHL